MFCSVLVFLTLWVSTTFCSSSCVQFEFAQEVSPTESIQVISNYSAASRMELFGICAPRCMKDIRCNAFDICNGECRTIRGWLPIYTDSGSGDLCERHQIMCQDRYFYDRQNETCLQHYYCDFESNQESACFLSESLSDEFDWTILTGATGSVGTGPSSAYHGVYYKYIETSTIALGHRAILESSKTFQAKTYCLTMHYHMYGDTINTLTIRTQKGNNAAIDRWKLSGNQGNVWHHLSGINLPLDSQTKVRSYRLSLRLPNGSSYTGDTAIDYVELWPFACP